MKSRSFEIYVDTGGTFTDCIGREPRGQWVRRKVLSNGSLRGVIEKWLDRRTLVIGENWGLNKDIIGGYQFKLLKHQHETVYVQSYDLEQSILRLTRDISENLAKGAISFEILSNEEAPIMGARLMTGTPLDLDLPALNMKLGSTKGTNALLERKGAGTVLFVTKGFRDLLEIGNQQRPEIFALEVLKRKMLVRRVIEVEERIDNQGNIIMHLDLNSLRKALLKIRRLGCSSAAISFLNSYRNPVHEQELASYLRRNGFSDISVSTDLSVVIKYLNRTETAAVNAYLNPVFKKYLDGVQRSISQGRVHVMTSAGGLIRSEYFQAKDSLLSGPAGGVVGAVSIGRSAGKEQIISFDMGGTSTDVARYEKEFDYCFELEIGSARIVSPALNIETVAAGGGSICHYDGFKLCVGPESAGAHPGPACYGAGGPITITDVNLMLGRLDPGEFGIPVFRGESEKRLDQLIREIMKQSGKQYSREEILTGFHDITNEVMAGAIRKISIARGYDPAGYTLLAFGGAGGMHACRIAGLLGMRSIMIPSDAGLLSAYGLASAVIERFAEKLVLQPLDEVEEKIGEWITELGRKAEDSVKKEGAEKKIRLRVQTVFLRFEGQDESLPVAWEEDVDLPGAFRLQYEKLYGHWTENRRIEVESIKVIASEEPDHLETASVPRETYQPVFDKTITSLSDEGWAAVPVYRREDLAPGAFIKGLALVLDKYSTMVVETGWEMIIDTKGSATLSRQVRKELPGTHQNIQETQLELFTNRFRYIAENMGAMLQRTSLSVNIKERLDFSCALVSPTGSLVANAPHIPVHLGSLGVCVRSLTERIKMGPGDTIITNHPAFGGSHLPDITLVTPVYNSNNSLLGYVVNRAHHAELGGTTPASMPPHARSLVEEGVIIEPYYLVRKGNVDWAGVRNLLENAPYPSRAVEENLADLNAALAANLSGSEGLRELAGTFTPETVIQYMNELHEYAASKMKQTLGAFPDGIHEASEYLDDGSLLKVQVKIRGESCIIDFTGTAAVHEGNMNANYAIVNSVIIYVLRLLLDEPLPLNEGMMEPVELILPECLLNPDFNVPDEDCPAIVGGNVEVSQRLTDTLLKAFGVMACSQGTMNNLLIGNDAYSYYETICGGCGAGPGFNGASAVHHHMTNTRITDPEIFENRYPLVLEEFSIRKRSGGKGRYSGGNGVQRIIRFREPASLSILSQHRKTRPYGMEGGKPGKRGNQFLVRKNGERESLKGVDGTQVQAGDRLIIKTPGGGGWGPA